MMDTHGNSELLDEYVRTGDQKVFAALVLRHVDLVYTAARRQVRDPHLAEDVAQAVFLALSRKAGAIGSKVILEGWLLNATRYAARDALRKESRRLRHETAAAQERNHQVQLGEPFAPTETERLEHSERIDAALDSALSRLASSSRDALLLRFFQNKSFRDVGAELGIGEDAAKQRVFRGLRQLRKILLKSGLELPVEGLGAVLVTRGILPAPPGLARAILSQAGKTASAAVGSSSVGNAATTFAAWTKAKVAAVLVTGVLLLGGGAVMVAHHRGGVEKVVVLQSGAPSPARTTPAAAGPAPGTVTSWGVGIQPSQTIAYAGPPLIGTVYDPAGNALADADVIVSSANYAIWVFPPLLADIATGAQTRTSQTGHFELTPKEPPIAIAARATAGFAAVLVSDPTKPISITVRPWARLQGMVRRGGKPVPRALVQISQFGSEAEWNRWHIVKAQNILCDDRGLFVADRVVPGINQIGLVASKFTTPQRAYAVDLTEGKTASITIGDGRTLTGRLPLAAKAFRFRRGSIQIPQPEMPRRAKWDQLSEGEKQKFRDAFMNTPEYKKWRENPSIADFDVGADLDFRVDDIPAGTYQIRLQLADESAGTLSSQTAVWCDDRIRVPPVDASNIDVPLDLGEVKLNLPNRPPVGVSTSKTPGDIREH